MIALIVAIGLVVLLLVLGGLRRGTQAEHSPAYQDHLQSAAWRETRRRCLAWTKGRCCLLPWLWAREAHHLDYVHLRAERVVCDIVPLSACAHDLIVHRWIFWRGCLRHPMNQFLRCMTLMVAIWVRPILRYAALGVLLACAVLLWRAWPRLERTYHQAAARLPPRVAQYGNQAMVTGLMRTAKAETALEPVATQFQLLVRSLAWLPLVSDREICAASELPGMHALAALRNNSGAKALCSVEWALRAFMTSVATRLEVTTPMGRANLDLLPASESEIRGVLDRFILSQMYAFAAMKPKASEGPLAEFREDAALAKVVRQQATASVTRTIERTLETLQGDLRAGEVECSDLSAVIRDLCQRRSIGVYELSLVSGAHANVLKRLLAGEGQVCLQLERMGRLLAATGCALRLTVDRTTYVLPAARRPPLREALVAGFAEGEHPEPRLALKTIADARLREMVRLALDGQTNVAIAAEFGCSKENVRKRLLPYVNPDPHVHRRHAAARDLRTLLEPA